MTNLVRALHALLAWSVPALLLLVALWAAVILIRNRDPGDWFWRLLAIAQGILAIQILAGGILWLAGRLPSTADPWLHYVYGGLFPFALLLGAHQLGRKRPGSAWLFFGIAALISFGLTFRALMTGYGWGE